MMRNSADPVRTADELTRRGVACHQSGDIAGAKALFKDALTISPDHPDATHCLGLCLAAQAAFMRDSSMR